MYITQAIIGAAVGDVTVVQHFEINVVPLRVQVAMDFIHALIAFFDADAPATKKTVEVIEAIGLPVVVVIVVAAVGVEVSDRFRGGDCSGGGGGRGKR